MARVIIKNDIDFNSLKLKSNAIGVVKPIPVVLNFEVAKSNGYIKTLEGLQKVTKGDYIMIGIEMEKYSINKNNFYSKYSILADTNGQNLAQKNIADDIKYRFIQSKGNDYVYMNNEKFKTIDGDYIVRYSNNEFGIVKENIFSKLYKLC